MRPIAIAAANDKLFGRLADCLGRPDLETDPRFATNAQRVAHRDALAIELESRIQLESADHWFAKLSEHGVPCGPINNLQQAFELAERLGLAPVTEMETSERRAPVRQVSHPIRMSLTPATYRAVPPLFLEPQSSP